MCDGNLDVGKDTKWPLVDLKNPQFIDFEPVLNQIFSSTVGFILPATGDEFR
jgi:hypothetical protein